ncbi:MAG: hypothetical protein WCF79_04495 [Rhodomicrobium sp.]
MELLPIGSKGRTEVLSDAANQGIEAINQLKIEIEFSDGKGSDIILELLQGFGSDAPGTAGQDKSQEGITLSIGSDRCLLGTQRESELRQESLDLGPSLFGLGAVLTKHDEVVGVAHKAQAELIEVPVEPVEDDVCQQGGDYSALWRALGGSQEPTVFKHSAAEKAFEEIEHFTVCHLFSNGLKDNLVREVIEEAFDICIQNDLKTRGVQLQSMVYGHVAVAALDEAEGGRMEEWSEDRVQEPTEHFLGDSVFYHGDAEAAKLSFVSILGNIDPAQRQGLKRAVFELPHQSMEVVHEVGTKHLDANLIDPGGASIALDGLEGVTHETNIDSANHGMNLHG